jgi:alpha,alpha-trehalose phosphorylase
MFRPRYVPPADILLVVPWVFAATRFDAGLVGHLVGQAETLFALSNGYLGMRGLLEECTPAREPGGFFNGLYEHRPISYGERAYGFPGLGQSILNFPTEPR